nr:MAG TPA: hypothetical protein [Caudoviricetes sp.]
MITRNNRGLGVVNPHKRLPQGRYSYFFKTNII